MTKRILLKLSGEVLAGGRGFGLDFDAIEVLCREIAQVARHVEVGLVVGGGNFFRGREAAEHGIERAQADYMGMLGTVINGLALQNILETKCDTPTRVLTAIEMRAVAEPHIRRRAMRHMEKGRVVIFAAGTGSPFFSTDTTAALRAAEIGAGFLVKATKVDGIYDKDPNKYPDAVKFDTLSYDEALSRQIEVMDAAAFSLCRENHIPIVVLDTQTPGNLSAFLLEGRQIGTLVKD